MRKITVIITALDDWVECQLTIASIRATAGEQPEIIVVDDGSPVPLILDDKNCRLIRNDIRAGVAASRHIGATFATGDSILLVDAHMRFTPGWYEAALKVTTDKPHTLFCCTCLGLSPANMDVSQPQAEYHGATINFHGVDRVNPAKTQFLEGVWLPNRPGDGYEIPCIMGACYLMPTDFFFHVGGLRLLKQWGHDEPFIALKWWLAGGEVRMAKTIRIGHQFRASSTYKSDVWTGWYNKMAMVHTLFPKDKIWPFVNLMGNSKECIYAKQRIEEDANIILSERAHYQATFHHDLHWYLRKFGLSLGV